MLNGIELGQPDQYNGSGIPWYLLSSSPFHHLYIPIVAGLVQQFDFLDSCTTSLASTVRKSIYSTTIGLDACDQHEIA